jgi:four helix bundle protein
MNYPEWLKLVPKELSEDPLWRMEVYRLAVFAGDLGWFDVTKLTQDKRTLSLADQLFAALGSVSSNIAEGYSRSSHKDQARFYEYALGSAREARNWYFQGRHVLGEPVSSRRLKLLTQIIRHLLNIIPAQRAQALAEEPLPYRTDLSGSMLDEALVEVPLP